MAQMTSAKTDKSHNESKVIEIDLLVVVRLLLKRIGWIILAAFIFGAGAFIITKSFVTPTYRSKFTAYVNNRSSDSESVSTMSNSDLSASQALVKTYAEIITSSSVLEAAAADAGIDLGYSELYGLVDTEISSGTEIITVYVQGYSPAQAQQLAQAVAVQAQNQITAIVDGTSMRLIDQPTLPQGVYSPEYLKVTVIAAFVGVFLVCALIILLYLQDDTLHDETTLGDRFDIPILGVIPNYDSAVQESRRGNYGYGYGGAQSRTKKATKSDNESVQNTGSAQRSTKEPASRSRERS